MSNERTNYTDEELMADIEAIDAAAERERTGTRYFVWFDTSDKTEQPYGAFCEDDAYDCLREYQQKGATNAGVWDSTRPWPFDA